MSTKSCFECRLSSICKVREKADEAAKAAFRVTHRNDSKILPLLKGFFEALGSTCEAFEPEKGST